MAARGDQFGEAPHACPFVALEDERDSRSESPDPRHRCYAEPTPQPRALAHQEAFCLSTTFAGCPIFQDWAARAAARPVSPVAVASASTEQLGAFDSVDAAQALPAGERSPAGESVWADQPLAADEELTPPEGPVTPGTPFPSQAGPPLPLADGEAVTPAAMFVDTPARDSGPVPDDDDPAEDDEIPPVPPFLAGRAGPEPIAASSSGAGGLADMPTARATDFQPAEVHQPMDREVEIPPPLPRSSTPSGIPSQKVVREDVVPSWEIDGRFGAQPEPEPSDDRFGGWLTAVAVVAILALGVAGVIFLPGLLAGGPSRTPTPAATIQPSDAPTFSAPLATPTDALPTLTATPAATGPTAEPTAGATPRVYRIRAGDSLARIARRFDVTVEDILAANPEIANPNQIQVGQSIVIPQPPPTAAP